MTASLGKKRAVWSECTTEIQELSSNTKPPNLRINLSTKHVLVIAQGGKDPQDLFLKT